MDGSSNSRESSGDDQKEEERSSNSSESSGDDQEEEESGLREQNGIMEMEVLECSTCDDLLGQTIFQDPKGNPICSACHEDLPESERAAAKRCHIMEMIVSSIRVPCKYCCTGMIRYIEKKEQESRCPSGPRSCPISPSYHPVCCGFVARTGALLDHLTTVHKLPKTLIEDLVPFSVRVQPGSQVLYTYPNSPRCLLNIESLGSYGHALYLALVRPKKPIGMFSLGTFVVFVSFSRFEGHYQTSKLTIELDEEPNQRCLCVVPGRETDVEVSITIHFRIYHALPIENFLGHDDMDDNDYVPDDDDEEEED